MRFELDRDGAVEAVAEVFGLDPDEPEDWRLDRFGADLGDSIAALADIVFASRRDLMRGPDDLVIDVHAILDLHSFPLVVCLWEPGAGNAFIGSGVEDARELVGDVLTMGPGIVVEALESLLDVVSNAYASGEEVGDGAHPRLRAAALRHVRRSNSPAPVWRRFSHPQIASSASGENRRAVLSLTG